MTLQPAHEVLDMLWNLAIPTAVRQQVGYLVGYQLANVWGVFAPDGQEFLLTIGQTPLVADLV